MVRVATHHRIAGWTPAGKAEPSPPVELCSASYVARSIEGHIVIFAIGVHHFAGGVVFFNREPGEPSRPRYSLWHVRPGDPELRVLTPFAASASFQTTSAVESVEIVDATGTRTVDVASSAAPSPFSGGR